MLELNCGTGEDAIFFATAGHAVHATDMAAGMMEVLKDKISKSNSSRLVTMEPCSFTALDQLTQRGPYDYIYSNFGGLNCTGELHKVLDAFDDLLLPGGIVTLVIISPFCLWETMLLFRGRFRTAFRRFFSRGGRKAHVEGVQFNCWYYSASYVKKQMGKKYRLIAQEGLCTLVPPSYIAQFGHKHPRLFSFLKYWENALKDRWPWKSSGDYYVISFRKLAGDGFNAAGG
jgi:cyclopropane fatty-acyl-phospholipid synthase-like methyltransferase